MKQKTYTVKLTQFFRPDGRSAVVETDIPVGTESLYEEMVSAGCQLEAEVLTTGEVSITVTNYDGDLDFSITPNGPQVQEGIDRMLSRAVWRGVTRDAQSA